MIDTGSVSAGGDVRARDIITGIQSQFTLIFQQPFTPPANLDQLRQDYLAYLRHCYRHLDMKGILQVQQVTQQLPLAAIYVPLKATSQQAAPGQLLGRVAGRPHRWPNDTETEALPALATRQSEPCPIEQALKTEPAVVLLGDPGAGKSTLLKIVALALAGQERGPLPILLPLNAYAHRLQRGEISLGRYLGDYYAARQQKLAPVGQLFAQALAERQAVILLDGLDEVQADRPYLVRLVQDFVAEHAPNPAADPEAPPVSGNRVVVTSRIVGYADAPLAGPKWRTYTLTDFDRADIEQFVDKWTLAFATSVQGDNEPVRQRAGRERDDLLAAIDSRPSVGRLASNPLLLTILAMIKYTGVSLPEQRVKLYELYLEALIESWNLARSLDQQPVGPGINYEETVQVLAPLALWLHRENSTAGLVSRTQLEQWLTGYYRQEWALPRGEARQRGLTFLKSVERYSNLLLERGERQYGFLHLTLEEMLAGKGLAQLYFDDPPQALDLIEQMLAEPGWHETLQLTVGVISVVQQLPRQAGQLLQKMVTMQPPQAAPGYAVAFAGQVLRDVGPTSVGGPATRTVTEALVRTMQNAACPLKIRRDAGNHLGRLGWQPRPDADDVLLAPAGVEPTGLDAFRRIETEAGPRWVGKYPVTNAQFARFVEAGGYDNRAYWSDEGWAYRHGANPTVGKIKDAKLRKQYEDWLAKRPAEKRHQPYYWDNDDWNNPLTPVVGISWYEAEAYGRWLSEWANLRMSEFAGNPDQKPNVRLLTEADWLAAFGGRGDYPWGNDFDPTRLNCAEAWYGREFKDDDELRNWWNSDTDSWREVTTTPATTFPQGTSAAGVWDGSGNVWEWQQELVDRDEETRVLRGGAWSTIRRSARVSTRSSDQPDDFTFYIGFRLVVAPVFS